MTDESLSLRGAWDRIPRQGEIAAVAARFTRVRIERIIRIVIGVGSAAMGVQAFFVAIAEAPTADLVQRTSTGAVFLVLAVTIVCCGVGVGVSLAARVFCIVFFVTLVCWPVIDRRPDAYTHPWIFFLLGVAVAIGTLAFTTLVQVIWAVLLPLVYGVARLLQGSFMPEYWVSTIFDAPFALFLGMVIVALAWMFRSVANGVDDARQKAVRVSTVAAAELAAEEERVAVAALVHDSVLAALIAAERADTPRSRELATAMAREALMRLADSETSGAHAGSDTPVDSTDIVVELRRMLSEVGADATVEPQGRRGAVPGRVARAIVLASRQAIDNAVAHAGGRGLHVVVRTGEGVIVVTVSDTGQGFTLEDVADDRLGIKASIRARMAAVAGVAVLESDRFGTSVELSWGPE